MLYLQNLHEVKVSVVACNCEWWLRLWHICEWCRTGWCIHKHCCSLYADSTHHCHESHLLQQWYSSQCKWMPEWHTAHSVHQCQSSVTWSHWSAFYPVRHCVQLAFWGSYRVFECTVISSAVSPSHSSSAVKMTDHWMRSASVVWLWHSGLQHHTMQCPSADCTQWFRDCDCSAYRRQQDLAVCDTVLAVWNSDNSDHYISDCLEAGLDLLLHAVRHSIFDVQSQHRSGAASVCSLISDLCEHWCCCFTVLLDFSLWASVFWLSELHCLEWSSSSSHCSSLSQKSQIAQGSLTHQLSVSLHDCHTVFISWVRAEAVSVSHTADHSACKQQLPESEVSNLNPHSFHAAAGQCDRSVDAESCLCVLNKSLQLTAESHFWSHCSQHLLCTQ